MAENPTGIFFAPTEDDLRRVRESYSPLSGDGLVEILLAKDWDETPAGARIRVDPGRAAWLRSNGYDVATPEAEPLPVRASRKRAKAPVEIPQDSSPEREE